MSDEILEDVKELLDAEIGSQKVLLQIKRAAENNEAISNYERNYVAKLIQELHKPIEPEVETPIETATTSTSPQKEQITTIVPELQTTSIIEHKPRDKTNTKVMIGGGAIAIAIIVAVIVGTNGIDVGTSTTQIKSSGLLELDQKSYNKKDIISISGKSKTSLGDTINLSIENGDGELIWSEDIKIKSSGEYSTLAIAGGPGWEKSGTYTLKMEHGTEDEQITFSFKN